MTNDEIAKGWLVGRQVLQDENDRLRSEVERLTRERDDCREDYVREKTISNGYAASLIAAERQVERLTRERDEALKDASHTFNRAAEYKCAFEAAERQVATLREALSAVIADAGVTLRHPAENCRIIGYGVIESARAALAQTEKQDG